MTLFDLMSEVFKSYSKLSIIVLRTLKTKSVFII